MDKKIYTLPKKEIKKIKNVTIDINGYTFVWRKKIYRAIYEKSQKDIRQTLKSGFLKELEKRDLIPKTIIAKLKTFDSNLVLEHKKIQHITYPKEWSFNMLKDAALITLEVNKIAKNYSFQTIDAHPYNILFENNKPKFIDIGSFIPLNKGADSWFASEEFVFRFYIPLVLWSKGYSSIATRLLYRSPERITLKEYVNIIYPLFRFIPDYIINKILGKYYTILRISSIPDVLIKKRLPHSLSSIVLFLKKNKLLPFQNFDYDKMITKINKLKPPKDTYWSKYQNKLKFANHIKPTHRYKKILNVLKTKHVKSITDLASNQGLISMYIINNSDINFAVCIDNDRGAIDQLYLRCRKKNLNIIPIIQNFLIPSREAPELSLQERYQTDAVLALAITHHLILTQNFSIDSILETISKFTNKFALVEFMPLGLWSGKNSAPVPDWYNQDWFSKNFEKYFLTKDIIQLEKNRILFIGIKKEIRC